jgi:hypothetical protein
MELWAAGFNAWNQLRFDGSALSDEPDDILTFQCVLEAEDVKILCATLCGTLGMRSFPFDILFLLHIKSSDCSLCWTFIFSTESIER